MKRKPSISEQNKLDFGHKQARKESLVKRYFNQAEHRGPGLSEGVFDEEKVFHTLKTRMAQQRRKKGIRWKIAASFIGFICLSGLAAWFYFNTANPNSDPLIMRAGNAHIQPGGNQATLTLSDGTTIDLRDHMNGQIANQQGTQVSKADEGVLIYRAGGSNSPAAIQYNTVRTPRGGQYAVVLPDGSRVWLNASSVLTYPTSFKGDTRVVELSGEGYFEITPNENKPFKVKSRGQTVTVLGTKFNVNSYSDEPSMRTTLLEGSVQIEKSGKTVLLSPGQQANVEEGIQVTKVNIRKYLAWKNGDFIFKNDGIQEVMRQVARWYNLEVNYQGLENAESLRFGGIVSRTQQLSTVLTMLETTGRVKFELTVDAGKDSRRLQVIII